MTNQAGFKMENGYMDLIQDFVLTIISGSFIFLGVDSIPVPDNETIITVLLSPSAESGLDVTNKLMLLFSTLVASVSGGITIYKAIRTSSK